MESSDGIGGTDDVAVTTRHHEYAGRYETIRRLMVPPDAGSINEMLANYGHKAMLLQGQCALILCDLLEEMAQVRAQLRELNAMNLELIVHRKPL